MAPRVTSHDVARRAGVSRATVSTVLNQVQGVSISQATRQRVLLAAAELSYKPNSAARMLVRGNTETVGLVVTHPELLSVDGFVPQLLHAIGRVSQQSGYRVLLEVVDQKSDPDAFVDLVESARIDGLIVLNPLTEDLRLRALIERDFPIVLLGSVRHPSEHSVNFSTREAIDKAVGHLVALGHRRIGHVTFSPPGNVATDARLAAYRRGLGAHGLVADDRLVAYGSFSAESGYEAMRALLRQPIELPTALLAGNDTIALGVIAAVKDSGLDIPRDMAVIGFDDLPIAAFLRPALTTIRTPAEEQGELAARMMIKLLRGEPIETRRVIVPTTLVIRQSSGGPRAP